MQTKNSLVPSQISGLLDFARWSAALLVVLGHVRGLWCVEYSSLQNKSLLLKVFYLFTGFGPEAVMVFFVLSGYLVGGGALLKLRAGTYSAGDYFISRFSRIYTVLLPALVCGGILDWLGLQYFNRTGIYTNSPSLLLNFSLTATLDRATFFGNMANLQGILTSTFGSNSPLWSLAFEWWYYCLFGLILELHRRKGSDPLFWVFASAVLLALIALPGPLLLYMVIWGVGVLAASLDPGRFKISPYLAAVLFALLLTGARLFHVGSMYTRFVPNLLLAAGFSLLIISLRNRSYPVFHRLAFHKFMADFSYTIYLMHVPLLVFITAIISSDFGVSFFVQPTPLVFLIMAAILLLVYVVLYLFSQMTERFTPNIKTLLTGLVFPGRLKAKTGRS
jgi:peptidoglycan/LPS O-acetylase OafA/YrhL